MTISGTQLSFSVVTSQTSPNVLAAAALLLSLGYSASIPTGTGSGKADEVYLASRTVASGADDDIDLHTSLLDLFGAAFSPVKVVAIAIVSGATAAGEVLLVGNGTNPSFAGLFGAAAHVLKVGPSGAVYWSSPVDGLTVTNTTADILRVHNNGASSQTYSILLLGRSA